MKIKDIINYGVAMIKNTESPSLETQMMIAKVIEKDRLYIMLNLEEDIDESKVEIIKTMIDKRKNSYPLQYILGERKPILSSEDISIDSPYNTYIYKGLPETAIASPGEKAIMAVIEPADTEYLYFLAKNDGSGEQVYSETYEEHLLNKAKYLGN